VHSQHPLQSSVSGVRDVFAAKRKAMMCNTLQSWCMPSSVTDCVAVPELELEMFLQPSARQ
jgi:hypothetical protein